jgi:hypothetical protein
MTLADENPLENQLKKELEESEWLQKFKRLSEDLGKIKREVPLTRLCELRWITESDSLVIHCPNLEIREELLQQTIKLTNLKLSATYFRISYPNYPDLIVDNC